MLFALSSGPIKSQANHKNEMRVIVKQMGLILGSTSKISAKLKCILFILSKLADTN